MSKIKIICMKKNVSYSKSKNSKLREIIYDKTWANKFYAQRPYQFRRQTQSSTWTRNFQMYKLDLEKAEETEIKLPTAIGS